MTESEIDRYVNRFQILLRHRRFENIHLLVDEIEKDLEEERKGTLLSTDSIHKLNLPASISNAYTMEE